jgi:hypothetical protein
VCDEWRDFAVFREWALSAGYREGLSIERKEVNGDYCPGNCEWIPMAEQSGNRRTNRFVTINGETKCLRQWAAQYGAKYKTVWLRVSKGMDPFEALTRR